METLSMNFFQGRLTLTGLELESPEGKRLVRVKRLDLALSLAELLKRQIHIWAVELDSPVLDLTTAPDGSWDLVNALKAGNPSGNSGKSSLPMNLVLDTFTLRNGSLTVSLPAEKAQVNLADIGIQIKDLNLKRAAAEFTADVGQGRLTWKDQVLALENFESRARLLKEDLSRINVRGEVNGVSFTTIGGVADFLTHPVADLTLGIHLDLSKTADLAARFFPLQQDSLPDPRLRGLMDMEIHVQGTLEHPKSRLKLTAKSLEAQGNRFDDLLLEARLVDRQLLVGPAAVTTQAGRLALEGRLDLTRVLPRGFGGSEVYPDRMTYDFALSSPGLDLTAMMPTQIGIRGMTGGRIQVKGTGISLAGLDAKIDANLNLDRLQVPGLAAPVAGPFLVSGRIREKVLEMESLSAQVNGGRMQGTGKLDMDTLILDARLEAGLEDIGLVSSVAELQGTGGLAVDARLHGPAAGPEIQASLSGSGLSVKGISLGDLDARVIQSPSGRMTLEQARLSGPDLHLTASGWMDLFRTGPDQAPPLPMELQVDLAQADMERLFHGNGLGGKVEGQANMRGTLTAPLVDARIRGSDLFFDPDQGKAEARASSRNKPEQVRLGNLDLNLGWQKNTLTLSQALLVNGTSRISGNGEVLFPGNRDETFQETRPVIRLMLTGTNLELQDFWSQASGRLTMDGGISGNLDHPMGTLSLEGQDISVLESKIHGLVMQMDFTPEQVHLSKIGISTGRNGSANLTGRIFLADKGLDLKMTAHGLDLRQIWMDETFPLDRGTADGDFIIQGSWENPVAQGRLAVGDLMVRGQPLPAVDLNLDIRDRQVSVEGHAGPRLKGTYDWESKTFAADLSAESQDLFPYFRLAGLEQFNGILTGTLHAQGRTDALDQVRAWAQVDKLAMSMDGVDTAAVENATLSLENGQFRFPRTTVILGKAGRLDVEGKGGIKEGMNMKFSGTLPLDLISPWTEAITEPSGNIEVAGSLQGPFSKPMVQADLKFDHLAMTLSRLEQPLRNMSGHIRLDSRTMNIDQVSGFLGDGRFDLAGRVQWDHKAIQDLDLTLDAQELPIAIPGVMDFSLNTDVRLSRTGQGFRLGGQVVLLEGLYYRDVDLNLVSAATRQTRKVTPQEENQLPEHFKPIALDIKILARQPMIVENNLADLTISPDLILGGTAGVPVLSGRAQVEKGVIRYNHAEFEVNKGVIDFINPYRIEPRIDMEGQTQIRDWLITLAVSGTPDDLQLQFSSDPSEAHADILSLIAFNKTTRELRHSEGGSRLVPEEILASLMADTLGKNIKEVTGLDYFEVQTGDDAGDGTSRVNVTLGADLSRQIHVRYGVDIKDGKPVQRVNTTYRLLENFLMNGYQDTDGTFGGEFKFRLEFR